jgi:hypothetical protein
MHNYVDTFDEGGKEDQGWYFFGDGGVMWLARRSTLDSEPVLYIVDSEKVQSRDHTRTPPQPDIVIPLSFVQKIKKERIRSTGATKGEIIRRGSFKILAEIDTRRGPQWFTIKMEMDEYSRFKKALEKEAPGLRFSA